VTATLRVVLDQLISPTSRDLAEASRELTRALIAGAPRGADVAAIVPRGGELDGLDGLADVATLGLARRELAASWQLGIAPGVGKGMIHSPTLFAPLVRHDRVHETHQLVVTLWDLRAWEAPETLGRGEVMWQKGMLKRAEKHADAIVVPTHAQAERVAELGRFGGRIRVIAGAAPEGFRVPTDVAGRLRALALPPRFVAMAGGAAASDGLASGFRAVVDGGWDGDVVVLDCPEGQEPAVQESAVAAGLPATRLHVRGSLEPFDRASVLGSAAVFIASSVRSDWPWRVVEAITVGAPMVAANSLMHREVLGDGGLFAAPSDLGAAVRTALEAGNERLRVQAKDRARSFWWREAAERVWQLHADL
jgi:glycosyltransferase involved in cell wall biosynthesis